MCFKVNSILLDQGMIMKKTSPPLKVATLSGLIMMGLSACSSSPTGRSQVILFSDSEMSQLGAQSFEQMKQEEKVSKDAKVNAYVTCVANAITKQVPKQASFDQWEVVVFESEQVNAFALPGGKIGVYTGLLNVATNQDQLATVLGHEVAHVLADHGNERMSQSQITNTGLQITDFTLAGTKYKEMAMSALGLGVEYGINLPYGRTQETEADIMGIDLMAKAGFNPQQSVELWKNMAKASGDNQPPELLSTHPSHHSRIQDLSSEINSLPKYNMSRPSCQL